MIAAEHIVIVRRINGSVETWETAYSWDRQRFPTRELAIRHGFDSCGCDDFNVAVIRDERLVWFGWMDKELDRESLPEIAARIGLGRVGGAS